MADQSSIISTAVKSECPLSIWDPCPQSIAWKNCSDATLVSKCRKFQATAPVETNKFFPQFVQTDAESNCNAWKEMVPISDINKSVESKQTAISTMPQYSNVLTKFRFCIILAGPPGSGKSTMGNTLKERANIINKAAAQKKWVKLGHDEVIGQDPDFISKLNDITESIKKLNEITVDDIKVSINSSENGKYGNNWREILTAQQENYDLAKEREEEEGKEEEGKEEEGKEEDGKEEEGKEEDGKEEEGKEEEGKKEKGRTQTSADKQQLRKNILKNIQQLNTIKPQLLFSEGAVHDPPIREQKLHIQDWIKREFLDKKKDAPFGNPETKKINNTELSYIRTAVSIINGINITYETSLKDTKSLQFLFELSKIATNGCIKFNYIFLMGFPIVDFNSLETRIISRYLGWAQKSKDTGFDQSTRGKTVGLSPLLDRKIYIKNMHSAYLILASLIWFCTGPDTDQGRINCPPGIGIDFLLLFDNTGEKKNKEYAYVPISDRSYSIGIAKFINRRTNIQTNTKKALIALLMRSLNCLKGVSCHREKKINACTDESCTVACSGDLLQLSVEGKSDEIDDDGSCWGLPSQDSIILGDEEDGNMQNYEDGIVQFLHHGSSLNNPLVTNQTSAAVLNLKTNLDRVPGWATPAKGEEMDVVFDNQLAVFAFRMLLENLPKIRKMGVPIPIPESASRYENAAERAPASLRGQYRSMAFSRRLGQLEDYYGNQTIYNYLKCIADGDAAGDGNISKCVAKLIPKAPENEKSPPPPINCLKLPNCGKTAPVVGGSEKKYTRKKKKKSTKRKTRRI